MRQISRIWDARETFTKPTAATWPEREGGGAMMIYAREMHTSALRLRSIYEREARRELRCALQR